MTLATRGTSRGRAMGAPGAEAGPPVKGWNSGLGDAIRSAEFLVIWLCHACILIT